MRSKNHREKVILAKFDQRMNNLTSMEQDIDGSLNKSSNEDSLVSNRIESENNETVNDTVEISKENYVTKMNYQALYGKDTSGTKKSHNANIHKGIKVEESEMKNETETEIPNEEKTPKQSADYTEMNHECNFCPKTFSCLILISKQTGHLHP